MPLYMAIKDGWDGRQIRKPGEVFSFKGKQGEWMLRCDDQGQPIEDTPPVQRPVRAGTRKPTGSTRNDLREECQRLGIQFRPSMGAADLAELIEKHREESRVRTKVPVVSPENPDGGAMGFGTGNADVI